MFCCTVLPALNWVDQIWVTPINRPWASQLQFEVFCTSLLQQSGRI